ncbi:PREDICTED: mitochondrial ribonuclease P protein 1 homolog [Priapulus caudatus]|uniref:RNA (guanine-9-)-methyltransferase domain-containing protein 1 n=1 Tax=Priapulus caudatus TaxID=37621 RepID=A0ABM1E978_PRICU|nr:PREDICTED: mitochondrial ribonuclease P protein 1 homolog [Priapulus caudatus]
MLTSVGRTARLAPSMLRLASRQHHVIATAVARTVVAAPAETSKIDRCRRHAFCHRAPLSTKAESHPESSGSPECSRIPENSAKESSGTPERSVVEESSGTEDNFRAEKNSGINQDSDTEGSSGTEGNSGTDATFDTEGESTLDICSPDFSHLSEEEMVRLQVVEMEYVMSLQSGKQVPSSLSNVHRLELLARESRSQRAKYFRYLFLTNIRKANDARKKADRRAVREKVLHDRDPAARPPATSTDGGALTYGLNFNTINLYVRDSTVLRHDNWRLAHAMIHGPTLVLDLSYDSWMTPAERTNAAWQMKDAHGHNKVARSPFHMHACNARPGDGTYAALQRCIANLDESAMISVSAESYLDLYDRQRLVYLSPDAPTYLETWDDDDVVVVGAMVDKTNPKPLSMAKAKKEGIRMAKLPVDKYVRWGFGNKSLTLDQVALTLLRFRETGDWRRTLTETIPKRKLWSGEDPRQTRREAELRRLRGGGGRYGNRSLRRDDEDDDDGLL